MRLRGVAPSLFLLSLYTNCTRTVHEKCIIQLFTYSVKTL
nr:MAG TPA: hypothetical protein [Caudoviricetes sp.]